MSTNLFLGNSHVAAIKLAYDELKNAINRDCLFYCASGADLAFTEVAGNVLRAGTRSSLDKEEIDLFFPNMDPDVLNTYLTRSQPFAPVEKQFQRTGGSSEIDLRDVRAIFYVANVSPYDFRRLGVDFPMSRALCRELLGWALSKKFLLREQVSQIRATFPSCRHYLIGCPLAVIPNSSYSQRAEEIVDGNRRVVRAQAREFLFDDVFMPTDSVLDRSLEATKAMYARSGKQSAQEFQGEATTREDYIHMNSSYGRLVFNEFISSLLE